MTFRELEKILRADGWKLKSVKGSHHNYTHSTKRGKVTVPRHPGDIPPIVVKYVLMQAQLL
jgi:predicted RNA binding protein YcfA (HicA-like mRNA interferase family)